MNTKNSKWLIKAIPVAVLLVGFGATQAGIIKKLLVVGGIGAAGAAIAAKSHAGVAPAPANPALAPVSATPSPVSAAKPGALPGAGGVAAAGPAVPNGALSARALTALDGAKAKATAHTTALMTRREWCVAQVQAGLIKPTATAQFACILGMNPTPTTPSPAK